MADFFLRLTSLLPICGSDNWGTEVNCPLEVVDLLLFPFKANFFRVSFHARFFLGCNMLWDCGRLVESHLCLGLVRLYVKNCPRQNMVWEVQKPLVFYNLRLRLGKSPQPTSLHNNKKQNLQLREYCTSWVETSFFSFPNLICCKNFFSSFVIHIYQVCGRAESVVERMFLNCFEMINNKINTRYHCVWTHKPQTVARQFT